MVTSIQCSSLLLLSPGESDGGFVQEEVRQYALLRAGSKQSSRGGVEPGRLRVWASMPGFLPGASRDFGYGLADLSEG